MRTGTHYFPRCAAAIERNRQKFGLKKIDETAGESTNILPPTNNLNIPPVGYHRRSESCDLRHERVTDVQKSTLAPIASGLGGIVSNATEKCGSLRSMDTTNIFQASQMSPDPQRHLGYINYRGFECKTNDNELLSNKKNVRLTLSHPFLVIQILNRWQ